MAQYNNAVLTLTKTATPDPYVTFAHDKFFLVSFPSQPQPSFAPVARKLNFAQTFTAGDRIEICFPEQRKKDVAWRPPPDTDHSADLWAPELHALQGRWYVYFAACHPRHGNRSHRMYVLGGPSAAQDPTQGRWEFLGPIRGMDMRQWAIDGTVMHLQGEIYFIYSGWPLEKLDDVSELIQQLYIFRMADPVTAASPPVRICKPEERWEFTADHGINEGPHWTKEYKMNTLRFLDGDPLNPSSWQKGTKPLMKNGPHNDGPWGPGHGSFMHIGNEIVGIYHATDGPGDGWENRKARMQRVVLGRKVRGWVRALDR
ncbi:hypothetical protein H2203_008761 [Taxawa tesnikishii (nom. ined.)]|nr:hypothetical protein H2203_008761 [Dothideales sp. JES 119]